MIKIINLKKSFRDGDTETNVLKGIDLDIENGRFVAIMGRSGAGKSTLLYQMGLLDEPTSGEVFINGLQTKNMTVEEKVEFRLCELGFVFQDFALLPDLTALENVALPLLMQDINKDKAYSMATEALIKVNLEHRLHNTPSHLSGGEQQRVSIARAIAHNPKILFADEPTANLDNESSKTILDIFKGLHKQGQTIVMVTHEEQYAKMAEKIIKIDNGKIVSVESV